MLDLACGTGRHTRFLLARGHSVTAVDIAPNSFSDIENLPSLEVIRADLESDTWPLGDRHFAGVIVTNYLWRPLLRSIIDSVAEGGVLIYETFAKGHERFGRPKNLFNRLPLYAQGGQKRGQKSRRYTPLHHLAHRQIRFFSRERAPFDHLFQTRLKHIKTNCRTNSSQREGKERRHFRQ